MTTPRLSLVIPAYNEEHYLPRLLDTVDAARVRFGGPLEVIVADNGSTDATARIARERGCRVAEVQPRNIAAVRNGGAALAQGEILCFVDADMRIHPESFNAIATAVDSGRFVAGATGVWLERWSLGLLATWCVMMPLASLLKMDTGVVFCRRADFVAIGGYKSRRRFGEDVAFLLELRALGRRRGQTLVRLRRVKAVASTRKFDEYGDWHYFTRMVRLGWAMLKERGRGKDFVDRYWYASGARRPPR